ncbi:hypothetical protein ACT29H_14805 [Thermophagus sp. OGC60D27]|uniref:hypothetical protein n=1 Tax=Thermophagus sp. OGC60D27 TaxID=3458415 RepID=UPI004038488D
MSALLVILSHKESQPKSIVELGRRLAGILNFKPLFTTCDDKNLHFQKQLIKEGYDVSGSEETFFQTLKWQTEHADTELSLVMVSQSLVHLEKRFKATRFFTQCRMLKIPYLILPEKPDVSWNPQQIFFPVCGREGEKEASAWCLSWSRAYNSELTIFHPEFKNKESQRRLKQLLRFTTRLLDHSDNACKTMKCVTSKKETIKTAVKNAQITPNSLLIMPATRLNSPEYVFTGPPELKLLKQRGNTPILFVNPRHDLYLPCN